MANPITHNNNPSPANSSVELELELLEALLDSEVIPYPWNPADPESEAFFLEQEEQFLMQDLLDEELEERAQVFYNQLDTLWANVDNSKYSHDITIESQAAQLIDTLHSGFANCIPTNFLDSIARNAIAIFNRQQARVAQMVQCVQEVLPNWQEDDLFVLARPYAFAMRSTAADPEKPESVLGSLANRDWTSLSEIEQARISLAIAQYALTQLENQES
jgi:hypothetical protein